MEEGRFIKKNYRVGSRKSQLAMIQTHWIVDKLKSLHPEATFEIVGISTTGDKILDVALSKIGEKSLFTKELEFSLLENEIDFVVHSLKDLPTELPEGLTIATIPIREDSRDAVILNPKFKGMNLKLLADHSKIGTSSLRRIAQLKNKYPNLEFIDIRGNLNTRLKKLDDNEGPYSGIILAAAGIKRMGWSDRIEEVLEDEVCMHAVGQGALGVECLETNKEIIELLNPLNDANTYIRCIAERSFLKKLEGGCSVPVGVSSYISDQNILHLNGSIWSLDGTTFVKNQMSVNLIHCNNDTGTNLETSRNGANFNKDLTSIVHLTFPNFHPNASQLASELGRNLGESLLCIGAKDILNTIKNNA